MDGLVKDEKNAVARFLFFFISAFFPLFTQSGNQYNNISVTPVQLVP